MRLLPMLAPMAQKIVRVDAHHQAGRRRECSDRIEVSAAVARGANPDPRAWAGFICQGDPGPL
jgi:hypothetical protein